MSSHSLDSLPDLEDLTTNMLSEDQLRVIAAKRAHNREQSINKLPPELISRIFRTGEEAERRTRSRDSTYLGFQDLATQTCAHWRDVAISDSSLWTYIHITRPPPHELAYLYLSRAGPTTLLDIDIEWRSRYWDYEPCTSYIDDTRIYHYESMIDSLGSSDIADVKRWKSLSVCVKRPDALLKIVQYLEMKSAPSLRFLSLRWKIGPCAPGEERETNIVDFFGYLLAEDWSSRLEKDLVPNLSCLELIHVPWGLFAAPPLLPYVGLTNLSLTAAYTVLATSELCDLLSANPLLETLSLNTGFANSSDPFPNKIISLPVLRSLSIGTRAVVHWVIGMLKAIDAPILHSLTISTPFAPGDESNISLSTYLSTQIPRADGSGLEPIYPSLRKLDIASFVRTQSEMANIVLAFPFVTDLSISANQVVSLDSPWSLLPKLTTLRFPHTVCADLGEILQRRAEAGCPVKVVVLPRNWETVLESSLPASVQVEVCPEPEPEPENYDSEADEYESSYGDDDFDEEGAEIDFEEEEYSDEEDEEYPELEAIH